MSCSITLVRDGNHLQISNGLDRITVPVSGPILEKVKAFMISFEDRAAPPPVDPLGRLVLPKPAPVDITGHPIRRIKTGSSAVIPNLEDL